MWNDVELLTNDDTGSARLCIDSRHECGIALYQVDTLVKVSSSELVSSNPKLYATSKPNGCVIVADKSVMLLDQNCQSILMQLQFETLVDTVDLCYNGLFLVVGERNGNLHLNFVPLKKTVLTTELINNAYDEAQKTYKNIIIQEDKFELGNYHMILLVSNGFFHISNLQLSKIHQAIEIMDFESIKELQMPIKKTFYSTEKTHSIECHYATAGFHQSGCQLIIGGSGDNTLSKWHMDPTQKSISVQSLLDLSLIQGVRKCQILDNLLFVLDNENILRLFDVHSLVLVWHWPSVNIHDFLLTAEGDNCSSTMQGIANLKLIVLTVQNNQQMRNLMVYSLPSINLLYSLEVSDVAALVQTEIGTDTIYLLEGIYENQQRSHETAVSIFVLRCLTEALPENRLSRLLYKHQFEEAEKFALQFGLDIELVYKVKLNFILENMSSFSGGSCEQTKCMQLVKEAKENLHKILDDHFVVNYCINTPWPTLETAQEMLSYCKLRVLKKYDSRNVQLLEELPSLITEIYTALAKLATFYGAFGPDKFSGISWITFLNNKDPLNEIFSHLRERNLKCAQFLWLRSQPEFEKDFSVEKLEIFLNSIPTDISSSDICLWFKTVIIPFVKRVVPIGEKILARWLEHRSQNLELTEKWNWPENGLEMAKLLFVSANPNGLGLCSSGIWIPMKKDSECEEMENLKRLVRNLQQLLDLYTKYNCKLRLSEFEKETTATIVFRMLDKVLAPKLIPSTLEKIIKPYIQEHNLPLEELLLQYIKDLLDRCSSRAISLFETEWEAKAMAVLGCMSDKDLIFEAVLQIMYKSVMPWSEAVEQLVKQHLEMDHPKKKLLQENYRFMEMKKLLRGYGIRAFTLSDDKPVMSLIKYILKQDLPCSLEDAIKVARAYMLPAVEVYILRVIYLIDKNKGDESLNLLKSLSSDDAESTAERLIIWARLELQDKTSNLEKDTQHRIAVARTTVDILKLMHSIQKGNTLKIMQCEDNLRMFEAIANLQEDFEISLSLKDFENHTVLSELCEESLNSYESTLSDQKNEKAVEVEDGLDKKMKKKLTETGLYRLASLLHLTEEEIGEELTKRALAVGKVEKTLEILSKMYQHHCNIKTGQVLFKAAQKLCHMLEANVPMIIPEGLNLPAVINELACQAATICSTDMLLDCHEMCKITLAAVEVYRQCQIDDYGFITRTSLGADRDPYTEWIFDDFFNEDGIVLDPVMVLPVLYEISTTIVPNSGTKLYPLDSICLSNCSYEKGVNFLNPVKSPMISMVQNLRECSQLELALKLMVNLYGTCLQHVISNNMDLALSSKLHNQHTLVEDRNFIASMGEMTVSTIRDTVLALLHKVFNCRVVDCKLALGYCTLLSKKDVFEKLWDVINNTWQNYNKILAVAAVGSHLSHLYKEEDHSNKFEAVVIDAEWGIRLGKLGISFQSVFRQCPAKKRDLIPELVKNQNVRSEQILQYCRTYDLDSDSALVLYLETLLLQGMNHENVIGENTLESSEILSHSKLLERAFEIIPRLKSTRNLVLSLSAAIHKLSPYNYETIEVIIRVMQMAEDNTGNMNLEQALGLLQHLKSYKRISPPVDAEHMYILEHSLEVSTYSKTRLPFHLILFQTSHCFWKIISVEISEDTFPTLLLISKLMKVCLDKLYMCAVNHMFKKHLMPKSIKQSKERNCPVLTKDLDKTVQTIKGYLLSISNPEWAAATSHTIAQELPNGPDKTTALKFCLHLAEKWIAATTPEDKTHPKAQLFLEKIKAQYQRSATENVLIAFKLNTPEYLKLTASPAKLIVSLYEHSSIEKRIRNPTDKDYPDIHAAAKEIAQMNNVDMSKIRDVLLEKWLCQSTPLVTDENKAQEFLSDMQEDPELMRVIFLLQTYSIDHSARILYTIATAEMSPISSSSVRLAFSHKSRALFCLLQIADEDTVVMLVKTPIEKVKYYLKCCIYLAEFEALNIPYTVESFHSSLKEGMIKGLWKNHSHEPRAVRLVTELCLEYQVYDSQLWNGVLQKLLSFNMNSYIKKVLVAVTAVHSLWQIPSFHRAWRSVILTPFMSALDPTNPKQLQMYCDTFVLLLKCPILAELDMIAVAKHFAQLDLLGFTLGSLLLIPISEKREQQIQAFLSSCNLVNVLHDVDQCMNTREVGIFADKIKDLVLEFIYKNELFEKVLNPKVFLLLKQSIIKSDHMKDLVTYLVNNNCSDDAASIIIDYHRYRGKPLLSTLTTQDILKEFNGDSTPNGIA
ncbi:kinetochore-associated protein 1 [Erpetoichthys calabaricus]|uniref:kinetochore-associated protein 1 n=1 Tax=Erpetoichthys calabaricus TaxID=27687 RepID=UPI00109FD764|nr:kinetochore-associated protein 1 [Erpetoichthys calabaricus]